MKVVVYNSSLSSLIYSHLQGRVTRNNYKNRYYLYDIHLDLIS